MIGSGREWRVLGLVLGGRGRSYEWSRGGIGGLRFLVLTSSPTFTAVNPAARIIRSDGCLPAAKTGLCEWVARIEA